MKNIQTRQIIGVLSIALSAVGCSAIEGLADPGEWELSEPSDDSEGQSVDTSDCATLDEKQWEPEDFTFVYFRYLKCISEDQDNIVFSPVATRLALGERAAELDNQYAQEIAQTFGYQHVHQMYEEGEELREELLDRRPIASEMVYNTGWTEYEIEDQPLDRLQEAVGLELYTIDCSDDETDDRCEWKSHTDRWSDGAMLETNPPTQAETANTLRSDGLVLRAQIEHYLGVSYHPAMAFEVSDELVVQRYELPNYAESYIHLDGFVLIRWRLLGGQLSIFFIRPIDKDLEHIASQLSSKNVREWIDSMEWSSPGTRPITWVPVFDIEQTWELSDALGLQSPLSTTTRASLGDYGINSPNPVELIKDNPSMSPSITDRESFRFDSAFLFFIYDEPTDSILNLGRISHP